MVLAHKLPPRQICTSSSLFKRGWLRIKTACPRKGIDPQKRSEAKVNCAGCQCLIFMSPGNNNALFPARTQVTLPKRRELQVLYGREAVIQHNAVLQRERRTALTFTKSVDDKSSRPHFSSIFIYIELNFHRGKKQRAVDYSRASQRSSDVYVFSND